MENTSGKKTLPPKIIGLYSFLFIVFILSSITSHQRQMSTISDRQDCSVKKKKVTRLIDVQEMLFSIKSFSLYDTDDAATP